ncbi:MAG: HEAT repeat protein [Planctomycetota bacterium]|jgi:HEAT repeat protein
MLLSLVACIALMGTEAWVPLVDLDELKQQLRDESDRTRRKAVQELVKLESEEAWILVLDALDDPSGIVADEAQIQLPQLPASLHKELFGKAGLKSRAALTPLRVAEALGRMEQAAEEILYVKALGSKDAEVLSMLLWSIERLAQHELVSTKQRKLVEVVKKLATSGKDGRVRGHALVALHELDGDLTRSMAFEFADSNSVPMRCAAAELLVSLPKELRLDAAKRATSDESHVVRLRAYEALASLESKPGVGALIDALPQEKRLRCAWRIVALLQQQSGMKYRLDQRPWKLWESTLAADWKPGDKSKPAELGGDQTVSFVGMKVVSERVAFLIDFSGSMWEERDGKTRKARVEVEMARVLQGLDEKVRFNLRPFSSAPQSWKKELTEARARNIKSAITYFEKCNMRGSGDYWTAIMEAITEEDVDTLMILGDGAPTGGDRWNVNLMKDLLWHENRFRGIVFDLLLVDCSKMLTSYWAELCEKSGGRCTNVEI